MSLFTTVGLALDYQDIQQLRQLAKNYIETHVEQENASGKLEVEMGHVDTRLRLNLCPSDKLEFYNPFNKMLSKGRTIGVRCLDKVSWNIYISFKLKALHKVVVAKRNLPMNHVISKDDITLVVLNTHNINQAYFQDKFKVLGKVTRYAIGKNRILTQNQLKLAKLIHKGEVVVITAINRSIRVTMKGIALKGGRLGQFIPVKNLSSNKVIEGKIVASKNVEVRL